MAAGEPVYLDHNATTPVDPEVVAALTPYLSVHFGNPSSAHEFGRVARQAVDRAREQTAALIGAVPDRLVFTGSGSESNALAIHGAALGPHQSYRRTIVTQATEHPSVIETCQILWRRHRIRVVVLPVDESGRVDMVRARAAIDERTLLVSVQLANGETGTMQPVDELARIAHEHGALMHTDACQAVGKVPVDATALGVDLLSLAGHKMYAPKGVAALYHRPGLNVEPLVPGGGQEGGMRCGTENVPYLVGLGTASEIAARRLPADGERLRALRNSLFEDLRRGLGTRVRLNGNGNHRLPNTVNVSIEGCDGRALLAAMPDLAASTGSACHAGATDGSPVLLAMGLSRTRARAALRLSLGRGTSAADVHRAADMIVQSAGALAPVT